MPWVCLGAASGKPWGLKFGAFKLQTTSRTIISIQTTSFSCSVWIMQAFVLRGLKQDNLGTETLYSDTLDFLEKGRAIWANVDTEDRGTIFEETFIRGVRTLHLEAYTGVGILHKSPIVVSRLNANLFCFATGNDDNKERQIHSEEPL